MDVSCPHPPICNASLEEKASVSHWETPDKRREGQKWTMVPNGGWIHTGFRRPPDSTPKMGPISTSPDSDPNAASSPPLVVASLILWFRYGFVSELDKTTVTMNRRKTISETPAQFQDCMTLMRLSRCEALACPPGIDARCGILFGRLSPPPPGPVGVLGKPKRRARPILTRPPGFHSLSLVMRADGGALKLSPGKPSCR